MQQDLTTLLSQGAALLTALGAGAVIAKIVDGVFGRANKQDDLAVGLRTSILARLDALEQSNKEKDEALEKMRRENTQLQVRLSRAEEREVWVRNRYHRLMNWMQNEPGLPQPPAYLFEDVPDPMPEHHPRVRRQPPSEPTA